MSKKIIWACLLISLFFPQLLSGQEMMFAARASAKKVGLEDQFRLTYIIKNAPDASNFEAPSFKHFVIRRGPFQSQNTELISFNGHTQKNHTITVTYVLQATHTGTFTIPPAGIVANNQQYQTNSVTIQVVTGSIAAPAQPKQHRSPFDDPFFTRDPFAMMRQQQKRMQQALRQMFPQNVTPRTRQPRQDITNLDEAHLHKNIFIKVEVDNKHPYLGEQITASYKLYTRLPMNMQLTQLPSLNGFWSEDFDIPNPPKPHEEVINGKTYQVFLLKKSALFPQQSGKLTLDPAKAEGIVRVIQKTEGHNPFADDSSFGSLFMLDPFFNNRAFSAYQYKDVKTHLSSTPVTINVAPLPQKGQPDNFSGAVGRFHVAVKLDTSVITTSTPGTFQFVVSGSGNFKIMGHPVIDFPPGLNAYAPDVTDTIISRSPAITGKKIYTYNLSPQQPGQYTIPSIRFSYFDPETHRYKTLKTQPVRITVVKGSGYTASGTRRLPSDIHPLRKAYPASRTLLFIPSAHFWYWGLYLLAAIVFVLLLWRHYRKKQALENKAIWKNKTANKVAWKRLATARKLLPQNEHMAFYEAVSKAIWLYLSDKLGIPLSVLSKENIADKLGQRKVPPAQVAAINDLLMECEMALYSPSGGRQQKENSLAEAAALIGDLEKYLKNKKQDYASHFKK